jgi:glycosyltransferase involved in cell wall biosynthesis
LKIVFVNPSSFIGGAELSICESVKALSQKGIEVHVIFPAAGDLIEKIKPFAASTHIVPYDWWVMRSPLLTPWQKVKFLKGYLVAAYRMVKIFKSIGPIDIVITNSLVAPSCALAAFFCGIPHIWYIHEFGKEDYGLFFVYGEKLFFWIMKMLSKRIIVNSSATHKKFKSFFPENQLRIVYYAVEMAQERTNNLADSDRGREDVRVVMVGTVTPGKRQEEALRAIVLLKERGISTTLSLIGRQEKAYGSHVQKLTAELGISDRVKWIDFTGEVQTHILKSDLLIICSVSEAFGRVVVEAMKLGKPVVGPRSGSIPELIKDGWNGLLYESGDYRDLAEKIEYLCRHRAALNSMAVNAYEWSQTTFNLKKHAEDLMRAISL